MCEGRWYGKPTRGRLLFLGRGQSHIEKLSLATYHNYSLFQVSVVSPKLPLYSLRPFSIVYYCDGFSLLQKTMLTRCSLVTTAVNSARTIVCCVQHTNMDKHSSCSCKNHAYKETNFEIHRELHNNKRLYSSFTMGNETVLPKQAQVVICGAGTVANSVAYHLVQNGWNDILVLEQKT